MRLLRAGSRPSRPQGTASQFDPNRTSTSKIGLLSGKTIDQTRKVLAKLGVSLDGRSLYVTNLALDLRLAVSPDVQGIDSQLTDQVKSYTVSKLSTNFKPLGQGH